MEVYFIDSIPNVTSREISKQVGEFYLWENEARVTIKVSMTNHGEPFGVSISQ